MGWKMKYSHCRKLLWILAGTGIALFLSQSMSLTTLYGQAKDAGQELQNLIKTLHEGNDELRKIFREKQQAGDPLFFARPNTH